MPARRRTSSSDRLGQRRQIALPGDVLRSAPVTLMGSRLGACRRSRSPPVGGGFRPPGGIKIAAKAVPLSEVEQAWAGADSGQRIVFTVDERKA